MTDPPFAVSAPLQRNLAPVPGVFNSMGRCMKMTVARSGITGGWGSVQRLPYLALRTRHCLKWAKPLTLANVLTQLCFRYRISVAAGMRIKVSEVLGSFFGGRVFSGDF